MRRCIYSNVKKKGTHKYHRPSECSSFDEPFTKLGQAKSVTPSCWQVCIKRTDPNNDGSIYDPTANSNYDSLKDDQLPRLATDNANNSLNLPSLTPTKPTDRVRKTRQKQRRRTSRQSAPRHRVNPMWVTIPNGDHERDFNILQPNGDIPNHVDCPFGGLVEWRGVEVVLLEYSESVRTLASSKDEARTVRKTYENGNPQIKFSRTKEQNTKVLGAR